MLIIDDLKADKMNVTLESTKNTLKIVDELADLITFHSKVRRNNAYGMSPVRPVEEELLPIVKKFYYRYKKHNDILKTIRTYVFEYHMKFEFLRIPFKEELCACTFMRNNAIFMTINSNMSPDKQFFAAAHELYRIYSCFEEDHRYLFQSDLFSRGSVFRMNEKVDDTRAGIFADMLVKKIGRIEDFDIMLNKVHFGSLKGNFKENVRLDALMDTRKEEDEKRIAEIERILE